VAQVYRGGRIYYGTGNPTQLTPYEVRTREFAARRRGVDPEQVRAFQLQVADELTDLHQAVRLLGTENDRLRRALRDWQAMHARHCDGQRDHRPNQGHW
jgi:DivIVA domain-containing protein